MQRDDTNIEESMSEPGRARLKLMHQLAHKLLSAHLIFGAICAVMRCKGLFAALSSPTFSMVHAR